MAHVPRLHHPGRLAPGPVVLTGLDAKRLAGVMRLRPGDPFLLFPGDGREYRCRVDTASIKVVHGTVEELVRQEPPPEVVIETWVALVRTARLDVAIEKCVEAGADLIRPIVTAYAARGEDVSATRQARWERMAVEAAEQSGRVYIPVIEPPLPFADAVRRKQGALILCDRDGMAPAEVQRLLPARGHVTLAIGPEGGWSATELAMAKGVGALTLRLGPNILRTETAAIVGTAVLRAMAV